MLLLNIIMKKDTKIEKSTPNQKFKCGSYYFFIRLFFCISLTDQSLQTNT